MNISTIAQSLKLRVIRRFRYKPWMIRLLAATGTPLQPNKWVFIVGCYNSGTTLLQELMAQHPMMSALQDEGTVLTGCLNRPEDFGWTRMWAECEAQVSLGANNDGSACRAQTIKRHWSHFYRRDPDALLLEKSIVNATRIPFLAAHFRPAYFIYIRRNGYAVVEGIHRKARPGAYPQQNYLDKYPIELCAKQWHRSAELIESRLPAVSHRLEISYEELCADPGGLLGRIAEFLEIAPFAPPVWERNIEVHGISSRIVNQNASSIDRLSAKDIAEVNSAAAHYLKQYGYYLPGY